MRASTRNLLKGTLHLIMGSARTTIGRLALSGRVEKLGGSVQMAVGRTQRLLGW